MKTPIYNFVKEYAKNNFSRMHMPGHKGDGNIEKYDITEIAGADSLYEANGIIRESERNASLLFGADTFYSAEGSSLAIRAMLYLINLYAKSVGKAPFVLAARNAHKTFISGAAMLDLKVNWLTKKSKGSYLSADISAADVEDCFKSAKELPTALYVTSPDYLGKMLDIRGISEVCHKYGVLLAVDNAHGAYLKFLPESLHPIDLGADICCDSAHKTLPCLTGAAYLHVSKNAPEIFSENAKNALSLFGSTSPSYLILTSLDKANEQLAGSFGAELKELIEKLKTLKKYLIELGYTLYGNEPMKLTIYAKDYGYSGFKLSSELEKHGIVPEFADPDFLVLMPSTKTSAKDLERLKNSFGIIKKRSAITDKAPEFFIPKEKMSPREAILSPSETIPVENSLGRTLAAVTVGCPPAVPILVSGEIIGNDAIEAFQYYGIKELRVIKPL